VALPRTTELTAYLERHDATLVGALGEA